MSKPFYESQQILSFFFSPLGMTLTSQQNTKSQLSFLQRNTELKKDYLGKNT